MLIIVLETGHFELVFLILRIYKVFSPSISNLLTKVSADHILLNKAKLAFL